jgi:photosystem II stability/assembly factor-like uncharacterized protein
MKMKVKITITLLGILCTVLGLTVKAQNYAIGENGTILRTTDAGFTWSVLPKASTTNLRALQQISKDTILVSASDSVFLLVNGQDTLTYLERANRPSGRIQQINEIVRFTTASNSVFTTTSTNEGSGLSAISSNNRGVSWTGTGNNSYSTVGAVAPNTSVAYMIEGINRNAVLRMNSSFSTTSAPYNVNNPTIQATFRKVETFGNKVIVVGDYGSIMMSNDDGATWDNLNDGIGGAGDLSSIGLRYKNLKSVAFSPSGNRIVVVGDSGFVARSNDGGTTWALSTLSLPIPNSHSPGNNSINTVAFATEDVVLFGGVRLATGKAPDNAYTRWCSDGDLIFYRSTNGGMSFDRINPDSIPDNRGTGTDCGNAPNCHRIPNSVTAIRFFNANIGCALINGRSNPGEQYLHITTNGGISWKLFLYTGGATNNRPVNDVYFQSADTLLFAFGGAFNESRIARGVLSISPATSQDTVVFTNIRTGQSGIDYGKFGFFSPDGNTVYCVGNGGIWTGANRGNTWSSLAPSPIDGTARFFSISGKWALGDNNRVFKTTGDYLTWNAVNITGMNYGRLTALAAPTANQLYAVGTNGIIYKSTPNAASTANANFNNGIAWYMVSDKTFTDDLNAVAFINTEEGFAVGNNGTVLTTRNGGATWTKTTLGTQHLNAITFMTPQIGTIVGNGGTIYHTIDGGKNWSLRTSGTTANLLKVNMVDATLPANAIVLRTAPSASTVAKNGNFTVTLVTNATSVSKVSGSLSWDSTALQLNSVSAGSSFTSVATTQSPNNVAFTFNPTSPVSVTDGSTFITLSFTAIGKRSTTHAIKFDSLIHREVGSSNLLIGATNDTALVRIAAPTTVFDYTAPTSFCQGGTFSITPTLTSGDSFSPGTLFTAELDSNAAFTTPLVIGTGIGFAAFNVTIPFTYRDRNNLRIRLIATDTANATTVITNNTTNRTTLPAPAIPTLSLLTNDTIQAVNTPMLTKYRWFLGENLLASDSLAKLKMVNEGAYTAVAVGTNACISQRSLPYVFTLIAITHTLNTSSICQKETFTATPTIAGGSFSARTSYNYYLMDNNGVPLDTLVRSNSVNTATISISENRTPATYRIGVFAYDTASGVVVVSSSVTTLVLNKKPLRPTVSVTGIYADTLMASTTAPTYNWLLNGAAVSGSTSKIKGTSFGGSYSVFTDSLGCLSDTSVAFVLVCNLSKPTVTINSDSSLTASTVAPAYAWYKNGNVLAATTATYNRPTTSGNYTVKAVNGTCESALSDAFSLLMAGCPTAAQPTITENPSLGTITATANLTPDSYIWKLEGTTISAVSQTFVPATSGNYTVIAVSARCGNSLESNAFAFVKRPLSLDDDVLKAAVTVFPSPNTGTFQVETKGITTGVISVYNTLGSVIYSVSISAEATKIVLPASIAEGIYFVKVESAGKVVTKKIVVQ